MRLRYKPYLKPYSRKLRNKCTPAEVLLWNHLKARAIKGYRFNRQKPLSKYIVDFYCHALRLVIELDGIYHNHAEVDKKDQRRQAILETMNLNFLRFTEYDVNTNLNGVLNAIETYIQLYEEQHPEIQQTANE